MKKIVLLFVLFTYCVVSYAQVNRPTYKEYFKQNILTFDFSGCVGVSASSADGARFYTSYDISANGFMVGLGFYADGTYEYSGSKSVYVHSYTRKQNGKNVKVKSHYRSKPNSSGTRTDYKLSETYFGYWLPSMSIGKSKLYSSPIVGMGIYDEGQVFLWGAGLKMTFKGLILDGFGLTIKSTNLSTSIGISCCIF